MLREVYKILKHIHIVLGLTTVGLMTTASDEHFIHDLYAGLILNTAHGLCVLAAVEGPRDRLHRRNLGGEGGGQNRPWVLGTLIYERVKLQRERRLV